MKRQWSEKRRKEQAARCSQNQPWKHATGPKTKEGKARSSMNAYKDGGLSGTKELVNALLFYNKAFMAATVELAENELINTQLKQMLIRIKAQNIQKQTEGDYIAHASKPPLSEPRLCPKTYP